MARPRAPILSQSPTPPASPHISPISPQERETESAELADDQPVIFSDIAFARSHEKAPAWPLQALASEAAAAEHFYPASRFGLPGTLGVRLPFPACMHLSDGFFRRDWEGPRRIKNAILLLEWLPSQA